MPRMLTGFALAGLIGVIAAGFSRPAVAEFFGCNDHPGRVLSTSTTSHGNRAANSSRRYTHEFAAQSSRPRVTIYPRYGQPRSSAKRLCRSWLVKEYRVSGPVIVPHQRCWWQ